MKILITLSSILLFCANSFAQNTPSFLPKWYAVEEDTTFKDKKLTNSGFPVIYKQDKENNLYILAFTTFGYQLSKIETKTGKKIWTAERNQSFGIENKVYFPKDFFFRPDGNIVLFAVKGSKYPAFTTSGSVIKCVYDAKTGKEIFNYIVEKKGGSALAFSTGALEKQIIESPNRKGYYFSDGIGGNKIMTWIRTVDTNFVANDTLNIDLPSTDISKGMQLISLSPFHQIKDAFYQMSAHFGGTDTSLLRTYFTKIDYKSKKYSVKDVSKYWFHGVNYILFSPVKNGFIITTEADTSYGPSQGLEYKPNLILSKIDTNGVLQWRTYLFPKQSNYKGFCLVVEDNKTDGYWVVLSSEELGEKTFLYYMNKNGSLKLMGELTLPDSSFSFSSRLPTMLANGDILMNYRTQTKDVHPIYGRNGTLYFERKQFEALITKSNETAIINYNILLYPNPVENHLQILLPTVTSFEYIISDMTGKIVKKETIVATNFHEIAIQDLAKGMYILNLKTNSGTVFSKKIVKQ
jgi:hypothetical protein